MKSNYFFKGLSWLILLNILIKPVWIFAIDRQVQNIVGNDIYGEYFSILNLSIVMSFVADAGLTNMLNRHVSKSTDLNIIQIFYLKFFLSLFYAGVVVVLAIIANITNWFVLVFVIIIQIITSWFILLRNIITAQQLFTTDAWLSVVDKFLMILICGSFLYLPFVGSSLNLQKFLAIQAGCILFATIIAVFILKNNIVSKSVDYLSYSKLIKLLLPFVLIILLMSAHYRLDGFLLERIHNNGAYEAGVYALAYRLLDAAGMIGFLAASFLVPFIAKNHNYLSLINQVVLNIRHLLMYTSIFLVCYCINFASWLQRTLYHSTNDYYSMVLWLCLVSLPAYFIIHIYGSVLTATGEFRSFILILLGSVTINCVLNLYLIPKLGAQACCISAISSQYFCAISTCIIATKKSLLSFNFNSMASYLILGILLMTLYYFSGHIGINELASFAIGCFLTLLFIFRKLNYLKTCSVFSKKFHA